MKRAQVSIARTIVVEDFYDVVVTDAVAASLIENESDKNKVSEIMEDAFQRSMRLCERPVHKESGVSDVVTYLKMRLTRVKE